MAKPKPAYDPNEAKKRTTIMIAPSLAEAAKKALGTDQLTDAIEQAFLRVLQHQAARNLAEWVMEPDETFTAARRRKAR